LSLDDPVTSQFVVSVDLGLKQQLVKSTRDKRLGTAAASVVKRQRRTQPTAAMCRMPVAKRMQFIVRCRSCPPSGDHAALLYAAARRRGAA